MGKSYRRHHIRPKRKQSRKRRGAGAGDAPSSSNWSSMLSPSMKQSLQKQYEDGLEQGQKHIKSANKMAQDLQQKANKSGKKAYQDFKYGSLQGFGIAKSGELAANKMKSSMGSMGSSMGFSSLSSNKPNVTELEHAKKASSMGVPSAFSPSSQTSAL